MSDNESIEQANVYDSKWIFNFLFPTENSGSMPEVRSSAVSDDEFYEIPNYSNIDDLFENELFIDTELAK